jgi:hypothetical protein
MNLLDIIEAEAGDPAPSYSLPMRIEPLIYLVLTTIKNVYLKIQSERDGIVYHPPNLLPSREKGLGISGSYSADYVRHSV